MSSNNSLQITLADYQHNGKYCMSGLAYPFNSTGAKCTTMTSVAQNGYALSYPYPCDPTNFTNPCQIKFSIDPSDAAYTSGASSRSQVNVPCRCSLGGPTDPMGFCESVIGGKDYASALSSVSTMIQASNCHTLDRADLRAQTESCGIGPGTAWTSAVNHLFNMTHWQYVQVSTSYQCVSNFFADSIQSLTTQLALTMATSATALILFAATLS